MANVSGFLTKTFGIFSDSHNEDICGWGPGGDTIQVRKIDEFSKNILPQYFKHSNFQSFVRQLNMYDFHKTIQDPGNGEFQHPYFLKDRPDLLHLIKRKAHSRTEGKSSKVLGTSSAVSSHHESSSASSSDHITDIVPHHEPVHFPESKPRNPRGDMDRRIHLHDEHTRRIQDLEAQQAALVSENLMLKKFVTDMKYKQEELTSKTDGLLRVLYHMFSSSGLNIPKGALSGIPDARLKEFCRYLQIDTSLVKRGSLDDSHLISNHAYGSSSVPILHMDTPMLDDFMHLDSVEHDESHSSSSEPFRKLFSFDTVAHSVSQPTDSSLVIRSNSLERLVNIDMPPPKTENISSSSGEAERRRVGTSIAIPENLEGTALTRKATIDRGSIFNHYDSVEGKESIPKNGSTKKRKIENDSSPEEAQVTKSIYPNGSALVRQPAIDPNTAAEDPRDEIPMRRLDSVDSVLATLLSFEQDPSCPSPPHPSSS